MTEWARPGFAPALFDDTAFAEDLRRTNDLGIDPDALRAQRRSYSRPCLDWTERRPHLAGACGAGLAGRVLELGWVERIPGGRALDVTAAGHAGFAETFGVAA